MVSHTVQNAPADAEAAVRAVVATIQRSQQTEDVALFTSLFRDDAVWTTGHGRRLIGRTEIAEFTASVLPAKMRVSTATYDVSHVVWVRPDVAIVSVVQTPVDLDGWPLDAPQGRPTYVVALEDDGWRVVAGQNTLVAE